ncbi:MAG: hypothetical protein SH817_03935 [Leptospira sp.]|nr:hypothetical protein [Leptospira sp.]
MHPIYNESPKDKDDLIPVLPLTFQWQDAKANFFTTITTLGTPLDLTTQELRIESLIPADEKTKSLFENWQFA